ncbi:hypothetical protein WJX73_001773 [Symbiochloris irregularis]|uniref:Bacterial surface antigen (D15) domain-containing protein n=1 Tax=Symbiochloris irregularis TaxID=706552 RepID=A0AAW1NM29_9CHLO
MSIRPIGDGAAPVVEAEVELGAAPDAEQDGLVSDNDFEQAYDSIKDKPLGVRVVVLRGLERTKHDVVARELLQLTFANSLEQIKDALLEAHDTLKSLQIFDVIDCIIDEGPLESGMETCTVTVTCVEKGRLNMHLGTYVQGSEGQGEAAVSFTNVLGYAESLTFSGQYGTASSSEFSATLAKQRPWAKPVSVELQLLQQFTNFQKWSSFSELLRGGIVSLHSQDHAHSLSYELAWRSLTDASVKASPAVRDQLGGSLKSALRYTFRHDTLDDPMFPLQGYALRSTSELGGLWPGMNVARYARQHLWGQVVLPLGESAALALTAEAGLLLPLAARPACMATCITDRFFLGGVSNGLQGFSFKGAGPTDRRRTDSGFEADSSARRHDALGGDLFGSAMAALRFQLPVPTLANLGIYGHAFVSSGSSVLVGGTNKSTQALLQDFGAGIRWTVGVGLVWPTAVGQLEVNLCRVMSARSRDQYRHGVHLGFGPRG